MRRSEWLDPALAVLATARITQLVTSDYILDRPRAWVQEHAGTGFAYGIQCPKCVSMWVGAPVAAAAVAWPGRWFVRGPMLALAASYLTGAAEQGVALLGAWHDEAIVAGKE